MHVSSWCSSSEVYSTNWIWGWISFVHFLCITLNFVFSMTQLHACLGSALGAMGPQSFLDLIPFNLDAENLSEINVWLFPILKQYTVGAHLSYFTKKILGMVGEIKRKSQKVCNFLVQGICLLLFVRCSLTFFFFCSLSNRA